DVCSSDLRGAAAFAPARLQVVPQRVQPRGRHVGIGAKIPGGVETGGVLRVRLLFIRPAAAPGKSCPDLHARPFLHPRQIHTAWALTQSHVPAMPGIRPMRGAQPKASRARAMSSTTRGTSKARPGL